MFSEMAAVLGTRLEGGHTETVMCIAATSSPQVGLVSGAECGELALWSNDHVLMHKLQIGSAEDDITSIVCSSLKPDLFYVAAETVIHCLDIRQLASPVGTYDFNEDEINEMSLHEKETFLAAADDSGSIKIINIADGKVYKTLRKHTNICSAIRFRPHRPWELISGGYDSKVIQWEFNKSRAFCQIDMQEIGVAPENLDSYVVSPPFVHSIALSSSGNTVAVGTENALVQIFDGSKRTLAFKQTLRCHTQGVSQVHIPTFRQDRFVISGGNDGRICIWDLENSSSHHTAMTNGCSSSAASVPPAAGMLPKHEMLHTNKINWITSKATADSKFIFIADNTHCPVVFQFPE